MNACVSLFIGYMKLLFPKLLVTIVAPQKIFLLLYIPHEKIQLLMNIVSFKFDKETHPHT